MKNYLLLLLLVSGMSAWAQSISIDESNAQISFHFLEDDVEGTLEGFQFTGNVNLDELDTSTISGSVITKTLDTNNWLRSRHLRAKKFFNAKAHPTLSFKSAEITGTKESFIVEGELTIKGITKTVVWKFTNSESELMGRATINSQDYDINIHDERNLNKLDIKILLPYTLQ